MRKSEYWSTYEPGKIYHVYNRSVGETQIFINPDLIRYFLYRYQKYLKPFTATYAFAIMPNHFHFVIKCRVVNKKVYQSIEQLGTKRAKSFLAGKLSYSDFISNQFGDLLKSYSNTYNKRHDRNGALFQQKYKRILVHDKLYFKQLVGYIHHNPIHHSLAAAYLDYPHTSYQAYISGEDHPFISVKPVLAMFGEENTDNQLSNFIDFHEAIRERGRQRENGEYRNSFFLNEE